MKPSKAKNQYFFEEVEDPSLWKIDKKARWLLYLILLLATALFVSREYMKIMDKVEKKFPELYEAETR